LDAQYRKTNVKLGQALVNLRSLADTGICNFMHIELTSILSTLIRVISEMKAGNAPDPSLFQTNKVMKAVWAHMPFLCWVERTIDGELVVMTGNVPWSCVAGVQRQ